MTPNRKVYQVKRYTGRRQPSFSLTRFIGERKFIFAGIAAAVVVVVVLYAMGVFTGNQPKVTSPQAKASAGAVMPSATPSVLSPSASTSTSDTASTSPDASSSASPDASSIASPDASSSASPDASSSASPGASSTAPRVLSLTDPHMQGDDVKALQQKLGINADGSFGPSTKTALQDFQKAHGLTPDGYAGPETLAKLGL